MGYILGLGRSPGEGNGYALQYSDLENSTDCVSPWGHKKSDTTERLSLSLMKERKDSTKPKPNPLSKALSGELRSVATKAHYSLVSYALAGRFFTTAPPRKPHSLKANPNCNWSKSQDTYS